MFVLVFVCLVFLCFRVFCVVLCVFVFVCVFVSLCFCLPKGSLVLSTQVSGTCNARTDVISQIWGLYGPWANFGYLATRGRPGALKVVQWKARCVIQ